MFRQIFNVASSKDNYLSAVKIVQNINTVRIEKLQQLLKDLYEHIKNKWDLQGYMDEQSEFENYYARYKKGYPGFSFIIKELKEPKKEQLNVCFSFEVDGILGYGVRFETSSREWRPRRLKDIRNAFQNEKWQKEIIDKHKNKENCWLWWNDLRGVLDADFVGCCNDDYVQLFDPQSYEEKLKKIEEVIDDNMQNIINNGVPNEDPQEVL